ncbi:hypothetical protein JTB14_008271 [Gonioctena quinquepunctata]|nr:hypothetical protein JTB14_008271 [Gonioctena quinquepunctata]
MTSYTAMASSDSINPISLEPESDYGLASIGFHSYNSMANVEENNRKFYYFKNADGNDREIISISTGSYEINNIASFLSEYIDKPRDINKKSVDEDDKEFSLIANLNTLQCEIYSKTHAIDFGHEDFQKQANLGNILYNSDKPMILDECREIKEKVQKTLQLLKERGATALNSVHITGKSGEDVSLF